MHGVFLTKRKIRLVVLFYFSQLYMYICLNDLEMVYRVTTDLPDIRFKCDLSTLHLWISSMECFLHIAYRVDFKKWQARGGNKELLKLKQKQIKVSLRGGLGINADVPKSGGSENSNNGNTARKTKKQQIFKVLMKSC